MSSTLEASEAEVLTPEAYAREAGLRYVSDRGPGIRRQQTNEGTFAYLNAKGEALTDTKVLDRITKLRIPPAWQEVWICARPNGHIQATGIDSRGRKQYRYHEDWHSARNATKFEKMPQLGTVLPGLRQRIKDDMRLSGFPRDKVLATVVSLLDTTYIRVGNRYYAQANKSYGLTTLRDKHVKIEGDTLKICFVGKKSISHEVEITDKRLVRLVKQSRDLPGYELFQYIDADGGRCPVHSDDVNRYLRDVTSVDLTAKDFRTWGGSTLAIQCLLDKPRPDTDKEVQKKVVEAVKFVASKLGNTPAVCRKYYIHPLIVDTYTDGRLTEIAARVPEQDDTGLHYEERVFMTLLGAVASCGPVNA
jgi:DNA topoisomerase-1